MCILTHKVSTVTVAVRAKCSYDYLGSPSFSNSRGFETSRVFSNPLPEILGSQSVIISQHTVPMTPCVYSITLWRCAHFFDCKKISQTSQLSTTFVGSSIPSEMWIAELQFLFFFFFLFNFENRLEL